MLFETLTEGFALHEVILNEGGEPIDYRILEANSAFEQYAGRPRDGVIGRRMLELHPDSDSEILGKLAHTAKHGQPSKFVWRSPAGDAEYTVIIFRPRPGQIASLLVDNSERLLAEKQRRELEDQLHHSRKMEAIGQLAGGIAHDFNNLLTAIRGNAELIQVDPDVSENQLECASQILEAAMRVSDLTQQLLAFGRKGKLQTVRVDLHEAVAETVKLLRHSIDPRIEVVQDLRATWPVIHGDPSQIKNMLLNLAINARDAMPDGGQLAFRTRNLYADEDVCRKQDNRILPGRYLELGVADTGTGIDDETMRHIFEPFFTTKRMGEGTGLGLAGAFGCVESHHGAIAVDSTVGEGSTFRILLPVAESEQGEYQSESDQQVTPDTKQILVVDDEAMVRNFAARVIRTMGYRVALCVDGEEAVKFFHDNHEDVDLVVLDLVMPRKSGQDAYREMHKVNPNMKVLLASGYSDADVVDSLRREGLVEFLNKPFQLDELKRRIHRLIGDPKRPVETKTSPQPSSW